MATTYQTKLVRCDSGMGIANYPNFSKETPEPYECAVAGDSVTSDSSDERDYNSIFAMKRTFSDVNPGWPGASGNAAKKGRYNRDNIKNNMEQARRVLCPFFMRDPNMDAHRVSCYNKGFNEIARLKQHLVNEHKVPSERLDYFKDKSFRNLVSLEAKWTRVYCTLFPDEIEEDIPSPCRYLRPNVLKAFTDILTQTSPLSLSRDLAQRQLLAYLPTPTYSETSQLDTAVDLAFQPQLASSQ